MSGLSSPPVQVAGKNRMTVSIMLMAGLFIFGGVMHFVVPQSYMRIMPPWLPAPMALVLISGLCEIAGGAGVLL